MNRIAELISSAERLGIQFSVDGDKLRLKIPKGGLSAELKAQLSEHKGDIIDFIQKSPRAAGNIDEQCFPLSYGQQALWFVYQEAPDSAAYNMVFALQIDGEVNHAALEKTLHAVVKRHPQLRMVIETGEGEQVWQKVVDSLPELDRIEEHGQSWEDVLQQAYRFSQQPFDLTRSGLRAGLFQHADERCLLVFVLHHLFGDARSMEIIQQEWLALYTAEISGKSCALPPLSKSYAHYVAEETRQLDGTQGEQLAAYWHEQLAGDIPVLQLPTDRPRPTIQTFHGASHAFALPSGLSAQLKALAQSQRVSLFTVLLAAFQTMLHRYTGQADIWVGTPTSAGRLNDEFSQLVGYFVNPVVLRNRFEGQTFIECLSQLNARVMTALEHQAYPFPLLVRKLQPHRDFSLSPVFQVMFSFHGGAQQGVLAQQETALAYRAIDLPQMEGQFDLTLSLRETELSAEGATLLGGSLNYNPDLFDAETIERIAGHFKTLLNAVIDDPGSSVTRLPLLTAQEIRRLQAWNETAVAYPQDLTLVGLFERQVETTPDNLALVFGEKRWSYRELNQQVNQLAHCIQETMRHEQLPMENSLIAICLERSLDMVLGLLAILKAGGAYVPIDPSYPQARIHYMLEDSAAPLLLTHSHLQSQLGLDELNAECRVMCLDQIDYAGQPMANPEPACCAEDLAYVIYTSGSTGKPKGAMNEHRGIVNRLLWMQDTFQLNGEDRVLQKTPFSFDVSVWEFFWTLSSGAALVVAQPEGHKDPAYLAAMIAAHQISVIHFVPSMLQTFLEHAEINQCQSLKRVICSGEALSAELAGQFFSRFAGGKTELHNLYGPTEAAVDVSHWLCRDADAGKPVPIGKPVANTRLYVLDANYQPVPIGARGELCIAGVQVGRGYLKRAELTAEKFIHVALFGNPERIYKTGDLAAWRNEGNIEYLGRIDHQVKLRGFRIELGEIETALLQVPGIKQSAVVIRETSAAHQQLVAYVVTTERVEEERETTRRVREHLQQSLPEYMVPALFVFLDTLPLNANGKIDRNALPAPVIRKTDYLYPRNAAELRLAKIWEKLFKLSPVCVHDDFFALGGDSLLAIRLFSAIKEEFKVTLPLHILFQNRTLEQLACVLRQDRPVSSAWSPLVCLQTEGSKTPIFFVHASGGSAFNYLEIATLMGNERPFYAIHPRGAEPGEPFHDTIEEMAAAYTEAIRAIQPKGPYLLAGWSFGGTVIFEMTRILERAGESVPFFIMIDSPEPSATLTKDDDVEFLLDRAPHYHGIALDDLDLQTSKEAQLTYLLTQIKMLGLFSPDIEQAQAENWFNLYKHHNRIIGLHKPSGEIDAKIIFFKPSKKIPFDVQMGKPIEGWQPFTRGGMDVYEAVGNHFDMISPANTPGLVEQMKECIKAFDIFEQK